MYLEEDILGKEEIPGLLRRCAQCAVGKVRPDGGGGHEDSGVQPRAREGLRLSWS